MFMPELPDDHYLAIGKLVYQFANLERWVSWGIIECADIDDKQEQREIYMKPFNQRLKTLQRAFQDETMTVIKLGQFFVPTFDFDKALELANQRNSLLHGVPLTLVSFLQHGDTPFGTGVTHVNHNVGRDTALTLDVRALDAITEQTIRLAECLSLIVCNVAANKDAETHHHRAHGFGLSLGAWIPREGWATAARVLQPCPIG